MTRQQAYLEALQITPWVRRSLPPETPQPEDSPAAASPPESPATTSDLQASVPLAEARLAFGPGAGGCLLLGPSQAAAAQQVASDLSRSLGQPPVWCWPAEDETAKAAHAACDERLATDLLILGPALASLMFGADLPERSGSARVLLLPSLDELAASAEARRACWQALRSSGILRRQGASQA